jgi:hypothetical protein
VASTSGRVESQALPNPGGQAVIGGAGLIDIELANPLDRLRSLAAEIALGSSAPSATRFEPGVPSE